MSNALPFALCTVVRVTLDSLTRSAYSSSAISIKSNYAEAYYNMGKIQKEKNKHEDAINFYNNEFSGRIAAKVMQTAVALRDMWFILSDILVYVVVYITTMILLVGNLNTLLKKRGYNFQIINAGIEGQSTFGHIYNFKHWFPKLKNFSPKLYIFYIGLNDYSFGPDQDEYSNFGGDGHIKNPESIEVFFDTLKSNSFFYDKMRILKHKYIC